jgi:hypothetical protein
VVLIALPDAEAPVGIPTESVSRVALVVPVTVKVAAPLLMEGAVIAPHPIVPNPLEPLVDRVTPFTVPQLTLPVVLIAFPGVTVPTPASTVRVSIALAVAAPLGALTVSVVCAVVCFRVPVFRVTPPIVLDPELALIVPMSDMF